jgi:[acyl-carrier-protein] S-malonyltransferase
MSKKYAFLFPGQGAQYPGMGKDFYETFSAAKETFEEADDLLGHHFSDLIFEGKKEELALTKNSQLAIYIVSLSIARTIADQFPELKPAICAGLSLGEYTALTVAGKISFADCLILVKARAQYMNEACAATEGAMQVILGIEAEAVENAVKRLNPPHKVWVANINCPGQTVISGDKEGLAIAVQELLANGAKRALSLDVSGAFHSGLMRTAREKLEPHLREVALKESAIQCVMNVLGDFVVDLNAIRELLIEQVTEPVRWERGIRAMMEKGVDQFFEIGPGKTLTGMNKKIGMAVPTLSFEKITDLEQVCIHC